MEDTASTELEFDKQLEALRDPKATPPAAEVPPLAPAAETPAAVTPLAPQPEVTPPVEETLEAKLGKIEDAPADAEKPSALTADQERILSIIPDVKTAEMTSQWAQGFQNFAGAFAEGNYQKVEQMFEAWNPEAYQNFIEHIYAQKVASGEWVERWVKNKENPQSSEVESLRAEIRRMQSRFEGQDQSKAQYEQRSHLEAISRNYTTHISGLFDQIEFAAADRRWVMADINNRVAADNATRQAIASGNTAAVNKIFKAAVKDYVTRDQAANEGRDQTRTAQEQRRPLVQGAAMPQSAAALPSDVKQVPKEKLDDWLDQELGNLKARQKR